MGKSNQRDHYSILTIKMAASKLSSIVFFLLFIIFSVFVDGKASVQMKHRKLSGSKSYIGTPNSRSPPAKQYNHDNAPTKTEPTKRGPQKYRPFAGHASCNSKIYGDCIGAAKPKPCTPYNRCKRVTGH